MKKLLAFVAPTAIAVALGPLVAGLAVFLVDLGSDLVGEVGLTPLADLPGFFVFVMIFAYVIGAPIALIAGLLVSVWMIWRAPSAIVVMASAAIATGIFMGMGALGLLGPIQYTNAHSNFLFTLVLALIAAAGCWLLTRRFVPAPAKPQM